MNSLAARANDFSPIVNNDEDFMGISSSSRPSRRVIARNFLARHSQKLMIAVILLVVVVAISLLIGSTLFYSLTNPRRNYHDIFLASKHDEKAQTGTTAKTRLTTTKSTTTTSTTTTTTTKISPTTKPKPSPRNATTAKPSRITTPAPSLYSLIALENLTVQK